MKSKMKIIELILTITIIILSSVVIYQLTHDLYVDSDVMRSFGIKYLYHFVGVAITDVLCAGCLLVIKIKEMLEEK